MRTGEVYHLNDIAVEVEAGRVARALGLGEGESHPRLKAALEETARICRLGAAYRLESLRREQGAIILGGDLRVESLSLNRFFEGSIAALLMAATLEDGGTSRMEELAREGRMDELYFVDAVVSEIVDRGLDVVRGLVDRRIRDRGWAVTRRRFSPGYGDVDLDLQCALFRRLDLGSLGMRILPSRMLVPEKSVIALAGIEERRG